LTVVLPDAEAFGAAWLMLAIEAGAEADPEPLDTGALNAIVA
jgi:hypothetical protein